PFFKVALPAARRNPEAKSQITQLAIVDIASGASRRLWNAPANPLANAIWSPDGGALVIGPTFMPVDTADAAGLAGLAAVEIDLASGRFTQFPIRPEMSGSLGLRPIRWQQDSIVEFADVLGRKTKARFRKSNGEWRLLSEGEMAGRSVPGIRVE